MKSGTLKPRKLLNHTYRVTRNSRVITNVLVIFIHHLVTLEWWWNDQTRLLWRLILQVMWFVQWYSWGFSSQICCCINGYWITTLQGNIVPSSSTVERFQRPILYFKKVVQHKTIEAEHSRAYNPMWGNVGEDLWYATVVQMWWYLPCNIFQLPLTFFICHSKRQVCKLSGSKFHISAHMLKVCENEENNMHSANLKCHSTCNSMFNLNVHTRA